MENQENLDTSVHSLASILDMKKEDLNHLINMSRDHLSLDAPVGDGEDFSLGDNIVDRSELPDVRVANEQLRKEIEVCLDDLTGRERKVLSMRFGLDGGPVLSLQKIGKKIGLSKERIRQIEKKAIRKIRTGRYRDQLNAYL
jgi:RNA polymerase sigma factor (sigma-70 family)